MRRARPCRVVAGRLRDSFALMQWLCSPSVAYLFERASASGASTSPSAGALDIINFVWWIGIGHAGTLISRDPAAVPAEVAHEHQPLRRGDDDLRRDVRRASSRVFHIGRPWLAYWLLPVSRTTMGLWPQLPQPAHLGRLRGVAPTSPCRCSSGTSASIPDLATLRDRATAASRRSFLRHLRDGLARDRPATGRRYEMRLPPAGRYSHPARPLACTPS